jgi:hypothetical protein
MDISLKSCLHRPTFSGAMMILRLIVLLFLVLLSQVSTAVAGLAESERWYAGLDKETRFLLQANLVLVGLYDRFIDGDRALSTQSGPSRGLARTAS